MSGLLLGLWVGLAWAVYPAEVGACLAVEDVPCAEAALRLHGAASTTDPGLLAARAHTAFYAGRYPEAYDSYRAAVEAGWPDKHNDLALYERTMYVTANWVEVDKGRFGVRYRPGIDAILLDDAFAALEASDRYMAPLLGGPPPGRTVVELFPDGRSFIAASSLMSEDVHTTGVVGLAKWSRLLITSPRARASGYPWQATIGHEYIHILVSHHTHNKAPVWLQEAIAKYLDNRWLNGTDQFKLTVRQQGHIARALRKDDFVTFEEMSPSLAKLPTAERASLAYAQLATLMAFSFKEGGEDLLLRVLPEVAKGVEPRVALAKGAGFDTFEELEAGWRAWVATLDLIERQLAELPTVLDGGDELDLDPLLSERADLGRFLTLGDILRGAGRLEASLVEYHKAEEPDGPGSPLLSARIARAHLELGELGPARQALEQSLEDYPDFSLSHKTLGAIERAQGRPRAAIERYLAAARINPFDPAVQTALADLYEEVGDAQRAARHRGYLKIRREGGLENPGPPIHEREGEVELPTYERTPGAAQVDARLGERAPGWSVTDLNGGALTGAGLKGQVVVLDFWATWCGPCRATMPHLSALQDRHPEIRIVGVTDEPAGKVKGFIKSKPVSYTIALDARKRVAQAFQVTALPTAVVIDGEGRMAAVVVGGGEGAVKRLEEAVIAALEEE